MLRVMTSTRTHGAQAMVHPSPRDAIRDLLRSVALHHDPIATADQRVRTFRDLYGCGFLSMSQKQRLLVAAVEYVCFPLPPSPTLG